MNVVTQGEFPARGPTGSSWGLKRTIESNVDGPDIVGVTDLGNILESD